MAGMTPTASSSRGAFPAPPAALAAIEGDDIPRPTSPHARFRRVRGPGARRAEGEELSVAYITEQFKSLGLQPGNPDGTYVQEVPHRRDRHSDARRCGLSVGGRDAG